MGTSGRVVNSLDFFPALLLLPVRTFFTMEGSDTDSKFANFTLPTLKTFLKAQSQNVSGNKQLLIARDIGYPEMHFFHKIKIFWSAKKWCKDTFFHPPSPFPGNFCNCNSGGICTASKFYVQLSLLYTAWSNAYSEIGPEVTLWSLVTSQLRKRLQRAFTRANQLHWTTQ